MYRSGFLFLFFLLSVFTIRAQSLKFIGVETGIDYIGGEAIGRDDIRRDIGFNYYGAHSLLNLQGELYKYTLGVKFEQRTKNEKFGLLTGLRYSHVNSFINKDNDDFFYFLYQQTGTTTEFLKIKELSQSSDYIGIPLEIRWYPFNQKTFRIYFVAGGEFSYRVSTRNEVVFYDDAMSIYANDIAHRAGMPGRGYGTFFMGGGFTLGKENKPHINMELSAPVSVTQSSSSLVKPLAGVGFHFQFQLPFPKL